MSGSDPNLIALPNLFYCYDAHIQQIWRRYVYVCGRLQIYFKHRRRITNRRRRREILDGSKGYVRGSGSSG
jgi:hypothetical protein